MDNLLVSASKQLKEAEIEPKAENNDKIVYLAGIASNQHKITDCYLGVSIENGAKLRRKVEMYQWKPYIAGKDKNGLDLVAYRKVWSEPVLPSNGNPIGFLNPSEIPLKSEVFASHSVMLGNYKLSQETVDLLQNEVAFLPKNESQQHCLQQIGLVAKKRYYTPPKVQNDYIIMKKSDFTGFSVGDVRISFLKTECGPISTIA